MPFPRTGLPPRRLALLLALLTLVGLGLRWLWTSGEGASPADRAHAATPAPAAREPHPTPPAPAAPLPAAALPADAAPADPTVRTPLPDAPPTDVHGTLTRAGIAVPGRAIQLSGRSRDDQRIERSATTDGSGAYRIAVPDGRYDLLVPMVGVERAEEHSTTRSFRRAFAPLFAAYACVAVAGRPERCDLELPAGRITVRVRNAADGGAVANASVELQHTRARIAAPTDAAGWLTVADLDLAEWQVRAGARAFRAASDTVLLDARHADAAVELRLEPTGALDVRLLDESGAPVAISAALVLRVTHLDSGRELDCANRGDFRGTARPTELRFDDVPPGRVAVTLADLDEARDGVRHLRYQPIDAAAPAATEVAPGRVVRCDLPIRYRAYLRLRGEAADGTLAGDARLEVQRLDERSGSAVVLPAPWQHGNQHNGAHFDGYLAPGVYRLVFTAADGRQHAQHLTVGHENIEHTVTLPW